MSTHLPGVPDLLDRLPWGSRICLLYDRPDELADALVAFFRAGIEAGQACLWIATDPLPPEAAEGVLRAAFPEFDRLVADGLLDLVPGFEDAFGEPVEADLDPLVADRETRALKAGLDGLRLAVPAHPGARDRPGPDRLEGRRILALHTHCTTRGGPAAMLEAIAGHSLALARRPDGWSVLERPVPPGPAALPAEEVERRVAERTRYLKRALAGRAMRLNEIRHGMRNQLQVVTSLLRLKRRQIDHEGARLVFDEAIERVHAISAVRDEPFEIGDFRPFDARKYLTWLCDLLVEAQGADQRIAVEVAVAAQTMPIDLDTAVPIGLLVNELIGTACRHAPTGPEPWRIRVALDIVGPEIELRIEDEGIALAGAERPGRPAGSGISVASRIADRFGGRLSSGPRHPSGSEIRIRFPRPDPNGEPPF